MSGPRRRRGEGDGSRGGSHGGAHGAWRRERPTDGMVRCRRRDDRPVAVSGRRGRGTSGLRRARPRGRRTSGHRSGGGGGHSWRHGQRGVCRGLRGGAREDGRRPGGRGRWRRPAGHGSPHADTSDRTYQRRRQRWGGAGHGRDCRRSRRRHARDRGLRDRGDGRRKCRGGLNSGDRRRGDGPPRSKRPAQARQAPSLRLRRPCA